MTILVNPVENSTYDASPEFALEFLRSNIKATLESQQQFKNFLTELEQYDIQMSVKLSKSGKVTKLVYSYTGFSFSSSDLGSKYTWNGLRKNFGMTYDPTTDFTLLQSIEDKSERPHSFFGADSIATLQAIEQLEKNNKNQIEESERRLISVFNKMKFSEVEKLRSEFERLHSDTQNLSQLLNQKLDPFNSMIKTLKFDTQAILSEVEEEHQILDHLKKSAAEPQVHNSDEMEEVLEKLNEVSKGVIIYSHQAVQDVDAATQRLKRSTIWVALTAAIFAGIISSTVTAIWVKHNTEEKIKATQEELSHKVNESEKNIIEYIEQQAENDPLRRYFEKIMNKL